MDTSKTNVQAQQEALPALQTQHKALLDEANTMLGQLAAEKLARVKQRNIVLGIQEPNSVLIAADHCIKPRVTTVFDALRAARKLREEIEQLEFDIENFNPTYVAEAMDELRNITQGK